MTLADKALSAVGTVRTFWTNFSIPCVWIAGVAVLAGGYAGYRWMKGDVEKAKRETVEARLAMSNFTTTLASNAATAQEQARTDQEKARADMDAHQSRIEGLLAAGFNGVRAAVAADNAKLRGLINDDPRYACLDLALPADYLRMLRRPGGAVAPGGDPGTSATAATSDVPRPAAGGAGR